MGGLLFTYMGPEPAPLLPNYDILVEPKNVWREAFIAELPCNWLQCMENSLDPVHLEWCHGYWGLYQEAQKAKKLGKEPEIFPTIPKAHKKIGFDITNYGVIKRRLVGDETEDSEF